MPTVAFIIAEKTNHLNLQISNSSEKWHTPIIIATGEAEAGGSQGQV